MLLAIGIAAAGVSAAALVWLALRPGARSHWPAYGTAGLVAMGALEAMLALRVPGVTTFFTALVWTAYIVAVDAAVYRRRGDSLLHHGVSFAAMALLSVPVWLIFEAYNLRLANWDYVGVPQSFWVFALGAGWAFATIFPGIFETADLVSCAWAAGLRCRDWKKRGRAGWAVTGTTLLTAPLVVPAHWGAYWFALVWAGFVLLLEPLQRRQGWPSLLADLECGRPGRVAALLLSGAACGFFWEFWNYWARARWEYIFPILHRYRIFAMPVPGFLGFPPFAVECFCLYIVLAQWLLPPAWHAPLLQGQYGSLNARGEVKEDDCPHARI